MISRLVSVASLVALLGSSSVGCGDPPQCAPGTLFVTLSFDSLARDADTLELYAQVGDKNYSAKVAYAGTGTTMQLEFAQGAYPGGRRIWLMVLALREGQELSRAEDMDLYIPFGCAAVNLSFSGPGDLSARDLSPPPDLAPCRRDGGCGTTSRDLASSPGLDQ